MTLTDEQFEDALHGAPPGQADPADRAALEQADALRGRLRKALTGLQADGTLAERIRSAVREQGNHGPGRLVRLGYRLIPAAIAAAALLLVVPTVVELLSPAPAHAATHELAKIHEDNLAGADGFVRADDRRKIEAFFRDKSGFASVAIPAGPDVRLEGGCLATIRRQPAASYLVAVDGARVTVIVTRQWPEDLGLTCGCGVSHCKCYHKGNCRECNLVSKKIGDYSYTAVGKATQDQLREILARLGQ